MNPPCLAIIIPCYNEQEVLPSSLQVLLGLLTRMADSGEVSADSYIICVDDCSKDATWRIICDASAADSRVLGLTLAHNSGQQNALLAGLFTAMDHCDCAVTIDSDLQDDPNAIIKMVEKFREGCEVVFGVRSSRDTDTWFKRTSARGFYKFQKMMGVETVYDHSEFRLMSDRAIHLLSEYGESNLFLRSIIVKIGLKTAIVKYPRTARMAGETKYPLSKMISLSIDGITSFTAKPMRLIFTIGLLLILLDVIVAIYALISYFKNETTSGWTSLILSVWFLGGLILMGLGIVGEYIGKIYVEVKHRPRYAIRERCPKQE